MDIQLYAIREIKSEVMVEKMMIDKSTPKTFIASDSMGIHLIRKAELPFYWDYNSLITNDPVEGRKEWNRRMTLLAEEAEEEVKRYRSKMIKEL